MSHTNYETILLSHPTTVRRTDKTIYYYALESCNKVASRSRIKNHLTWDGADVELGQESLKTLVSVLSGKLEKRDKCSD